MALGAKRSPSRQDKIPYRRTRRKSISQSSQAEDDSKDGHEERAPRRRPARATPLPGRGEGVFAGGRRREAR
jgi:hypothetical protein